MVLFFKSDVLGTFKIPYVSEEEFDKWQAWSESFREFKLWLGLLFVLTGLNFLMIASIRLPSLGILFDTVGVAKRDLCSFTLIVFMFITLFILVCYVSFG